MHLPLPNFGKATSFVCECISSFMPNRPCTRLCKVPPGGEGLASPSHHLSLGTCEGGFIAMDFV